MKVQTKLIIMVIVFMIGTISFRFGCTSLHNVTKMEKRIQAQVELINEQNKLIEVQDQIIRHQIEMMADEEHIILMDVCNRKSWQIFNSLFEFINNSLRDKG